MGGLCCTRKPKTKHCDSDDLPHEKPPAPENKDEKPDNTAAVHREQQTRNSKDKKQDKKQEPQIRKSQQGKQEESQITDHPKPLTTDKRKPKGSQIQHQDNLDKPKESPVEPKNAKRDSTYDNVQKDADEGHGSESLKTTAIVYQPQKSTDNGKSQRSQNQQEDKIQQTAAYRLPQQSYIQQEELQAPKTQKEETYQAHAAKLYKDLPPATDMIYHSTSAQEQLYIEPRIENYMNMPSHRENFEKNSGLYSQQQKVNTNDHHVSNALAYNSHSTHRASPSVNYKPAAKTSPVYVTDVDDALTVLGLHGKRNDALSTDRVHSPKTASSPTDDQMDKFSVNMVEEINTAESESSDTSLLDNELDTRNNYSQISKVDTRLRAEDESSSTEMKKVEEFNALTEVRQMKEPSPSRQTILGNGEKHHDDKSLYGGSVIEPYPLLKEGTATHLIAGITHDCTQNVETDLVNKMENDHVAHLGTVDDGPVDKYSKRPDGQVDESCKVSHSEEVHVGNSQVEELTDDRKGAINYDQEWRNCITSEDDLKDVDFDDPKFADPEEPIDYGNVIDQDTSNACDHELIQAKEHETEQNENNEPRFVLNSFDASNANADCDVVKPGTPVEHCYKDTESQEEHNRVEQSLGVGMQSRKCDALGPASEMTGICTKENIATSEMIVIYRRENTADEQTTQADDQSRYQNFGGEEILAKSSQSVFSPSGDTRNLPSTNISESYENGEKDLKNDDNETQRNEKIDADEQMMSKDGQLSHPDLGLQDILLLNGKDSKNTGKTAVLNRNASEANFENDDRSLNENNLNSSDVDQPVNYGNGRPENKQQNGQTAHNNSSKRKKRKKKKKPGKVTPEIDESGITKPPTFQSMQKVHPKGLQNLGNTCFFNAVMQNLGQSLLLNSCLAKYLSDLKENTPGHPITRSLGEFYAEFTRGGSGHLNPRHLLNSICQRSPRFSGGRQQDSHELLRHLLDGLRNERKEASSASESDKRKILTTVDEVFGGHFMTVYTCGDCHKPYHVCEPMLDISLPIAYNDDEINEEAKYLSKETYQPNQENQESFDYSEAAKYLMMPLSSKKTMPVEYTHEERGPHGEQHYSNQSRTNGSRQTEARDQYEPKKKKQKTGDGKRSILDCLDVFTRTEFMKDEYLCMACQAEREQRGITDYIMASATKRTLVYNPPALLTLHLKRFEQKSRGFEKCNKMITYPVELDLGPYCSRCCKRNEGNEDIWYSLYGVVVHGGSLSGGHYVAYVKSREPEMNTEQFLQKEFLDRNNLTQEKLVEEVEKCREEATDFVEWKPHQSKGKWYHVSDDYVSSVSESDVLNKQAYLLFYERLPNPKKVTHF